jgi:ABC-2 type transport system permease protein
MKQFFGLFRSEFNMSIRRPGLWVAYLIVFGFFGGSMFAPSSLGTTDVFSSTPTLQQAGETVYMFNMLMPLVAGILAADRIQRDLKLGLRELQTSAPLRSVTYILGKYFGVLAAELLPLFIWVILLGLIATAAGLASASILAGILAAFLTITLPSFAFVIAFSLACPLIMPLRVYQILFTGYWFWGNYLNSAVFPTVSDTLLNSSGVYALQGFFRGTISQTSEALYTPAQAWLNIIILCVCAAAALTAVQRYFAWQSKRA